MKKIVLFIFASFLCFSESSAQGFLNKLINSVSSRIGNNQSHNSNNGASFNNQNHTGTQPSNLIKNVTTEQPSQNNEKTVVLVADGSGNTKEEATKNALRNAIDQAFVTFVSANTKVLDDELIKDEIVTVSTGNIKTYKELSSIKTDGGYEVSVQATVSIDQLTKFAQGKGMQTELAGASFVMNMKMRELNKKNECTAIQHMIEKAKVIANNGLFDYKLEIGEPQLLVEGKYAIKIKLLICENDNTKSFYDFIYQTLGSLTLSEKEALEYCKTRIPFYCYNKHLMGGLCEIRNTDSFKYYRAYFYLRNKLPSLNGFGYHDERFVLYHLIFENALKYVIQDNLGTQVVCEKKYINIDTRQPNQTVWDYASNGKVKHFFAYSYIDKERDMVSVYEMLPYNRLLKYDKDYDSRKSDYLDILKRGCISLLFGFNDVFYFNPALDANGKERRRIEGPDVCFRQEFYLLYSEEELSRLNNITIERRMD